MVLSFSVVRRNIFNGYMHALFMMGYWAIKFGITPTKELFDISDIES